MLRIRQHKLIYVRIPRTGTHSMTAWLRENFKTRRVAHYHQWQVPLKYQNWTVFTTVRHPIERCFSYWWISNRTDNPEPPDWSFDEFLEHLIDIRDTNYAIKQDIEVPKMDMNQTNYFKKSGATIYLQIENIEQEVAVKLPFPEADKNQIGKLNIGLEKPKLDIKKYCTDKTLPLIDNYCGEDFNEFGYSWDGYRLC